MLIDRGFRKRFVGFPNPDAFGNAPKPFQQRWANLLQQVFSHVFSSWVVRHDEKPAWLDHFQGCNRVLILIGYEEAMVPVLVEPAFAFGLEIRKVHDSSDGILRFSGYEKVRHVIVPVEMFAFATMFEQSMASAEFDSTHDGETHKFGFLMWLTGLVKRVISRVLVLRLKFRVVPMSLGVAASLFRQVFVDSFRQVDTRLVGKADEHEKYVRHFVR